jgi:mycothiol synthase
MWEIQVLEMVDLTSVTLRNYRDGDQTLVVDLINETDQVDQFDRRVTLRDIEHDWDDPNFTPEEDGFLAVVWQDGVEQAVAAGDVYLPTLTDAAEAIAAITWHVVRPEWRGLGIGRQILEACYRRATGLVAGIDDPRPGLLRIVGVHARDGDARRRLERFGAELVRTFYRMEYAPLDGNLPTPDVPPGLSIVPWTPAHDQATLETFNDSFKDHWGFPGISHAMWQQWFHDPKSQPELWRIALDDETGEVAGICIVKIDSERNATLGRREGWIRELGVRRPWRKRGLGTALLLAGMAVLREAGMTSVRLGVDSDSLTNATRLYERVGYRVISEWLTYHKPIEWTRSTCTHFSSMERFGEASPIAT